jgi:hypothetical protein
MFFSFLKQRNYLYMLFFVSKKNCFLLKQRNLTSLCSPYNDGFLSLGGSPYNDVPFKKWNVILLGEQRELRDGKLLTLSFGGLAAKIKSMVFIMKS